MDRKDSLSRRTVLQAAGAGVLAAAVPGLEAAWADQPVKGNIKQSVCRWCYGKIPLDQLAAAAKKMGYRSIELLTPGEFAQVKEQGLTCAMLRCASIADGLNRKENHARIEKELRDNIEFAAANGIPNVICMSGNRK